MTPSVSARILCMLMHLLEVSQYVTGINSDVSCETVDFEAADCDAGQRLFAT